MEQGILIAINRVNIPFLYLQEHFGQYAAIALAQAQFEKLCFAWIQNTEKSIRKLCLLEVESVSTLEVENRCGLKMKFRSRSA